MLRRSIFVTGIALLVAACAQKAEYYESAGFTGIHEGGKSGAATEPRVTVDVFVDGAPAGSEPPTALDLTPEGQAAFIAAVAGQPGELTEELAAPIQRKSPKSAVDRSNLKVKRQLTFTIATSHLPPADRITEARISVTGSEGWRFVKAQGFEAVRSDIKVATVVDALTRRLKANSNINLSNVLTELTGTSLEGEVTAANTITRDLQFDVVEFLPLVREDRLEFWLKAPFPQVNLAGAYRGTVTLEYQGKYKNAVTTQFDLKSSPVPAVRRLTAYVPRPGDIELETHMSYRARLVENSDGRKSLKEDDDEVVYVDVGPDLSSPRADQGKTDAVVGREYPWVKRSVELAEATEVSALMIDGVPLKLHLPAKDNSSKYASCILGDGAALQSFTRWLVGDPANRVAQKTKAGDALWTLVDPQTFKRLAPTALRAGDALTIIRFALNSSDMPVPQAVRDHCHLDIAVGGN